MSNAYAIHALESTWGVTPSTGWREVEIDGDDFNTVIEPMERNGLKRGAAAPLLAGRRNTAKGGKGTIPLAGATNGLGPFLAVAASSATSTLVSGATAAFEQVFKWTSAGPPLSRSLATEMRRDRYDGSFDAFTYLGGRCEQLEIGQDLDGWLTMVLGMDYSQVVLQGSVPVRTILSVTPDLLYNWEDPLITLTPKGEDPEDEGNTECLSSFNLTLPNELDTEKWCLKRGTGKHEPKRKGRPAPTGTLTWDYEDPRYYTAFKNQEPFTLSATWQAPTAIEAAIFPSLTIDIATLVFTGEDPHSSPDENTTQNLPFAVVDDAGHDLDDSDAAVVTITQVTSDTTL